MAQARALPAEEAFPPAFREALDDDVNVPGALAVVFGFGIAEDGAVVRQFLESGLEFFVSTSFSKSFSLYGERVGALSVVCGTKDEAARVLSQLKIVIRTNYSNPPTHGAQVVATVLGTPALRAQWEAELGTMRASTPNSDSRDCEYRPAPKRRRQRSLTSHNPLSRGSSANARSEPTANADARNPGTSSSDPRARRHRRKTSPSAVAPRHADSSSGWK